MTTKLKDFIKIINLTTIFIVGVMVFVVFLFFNTQNTTKIENEYNSYQNSLKNLQIINKDFNAFFHNQRKVMNFDAIAKHTIQFQNILSMLKNSNIGGLQHKSLENNLKKVEKLFLRKKSLLEKFKSYNAISIYTYTSIIDLSSSIKNDKVFSRKEKDIVVKLIDNSIIDLFKLYYNLQIDAKPLYNNALKLGKLKKQTKDLRSFQIKIESSTKMLQKINDIKTKALKIPLEKEILILQKKSNIQYSAILKKQEKFLGYMFIIVFILLAILIYIYKITIKNKKELVSFKYAVENSDDSIIITDADRHITYANEAFTKNTGYTKEEALGQNPSMLKSGELPDEFYANLNSILDKGQKWSGDFINKTKNGEIYYEKSSITPMFSNKKLTGYLAIKLNISEYVKEKKKVEFLAYHDALTLLPNRRQLKKTISQALKNYETDNTMLYLLFLDLDGFKNINDTLGHDTGDFLLCEISKKIVKYLKEKNQVFRTGGDEFAILIYSNTHTSDCEKAAQDILELINEPIYLDEHTLRVGASIGISSFADTKDLITLLKYADIAMYQAKQNGKNRYVYYTKKLSNILAKKMETEEALKSAFKNDEFYMVYQPKYDLKTKKILSLEALIRWKNSDLGMVPPDYFIPIAEEMDVINTIGEFVFRKSCEDFIYFHKFIKDLQNISVNVSSSQLKDKNLLNNFKNIVKETGVSPQDIDIEITETHIMDNIEENIHILNDMRNYGFGIALDDFGTGYSSMNYLKKLPLTSLKIDKSFVDNICNDAKDLAIAKATISISRNFNCETIVAEGIETKEQEKLLLEIGVNQGQGYLFSKPKKKADFIEFLRKLSYSHPRPN